MRVWGRALSLATASTVSLLLLLYPYVLNGIPGWRVHTGLPIMMLGVAALFMYGLGYHAKSRIVRALFHPAVGWLLFAVGIAVIAWSE